MPSKPRPRVKGRPSVYGPRFSRSNASRVSYVQQPIDVSIMEVMSLYRLLTASLIARLLGRKLSLIQARCLRLFKHGYLRRLKGGSAAILYAPAWLARSNGSTLDHACMGVRMWVTLELYARMTPGFTYAWTPEWTHRREGGDVIPDATAFLRCRAPDGMWVGAMYYVECDRATEPPGRVVEKCQGYLKMWEDVKAADANAQPFRVLWVGPSERRIESLRKGVREKLGNERMFGFASEEWFCPEDPNTIAGPIWLRPAGEKRFSMIPQS